MRYHSVYLLPAILSCLAGCAAKRPPEPAAKTSPRPHSLVTPSDAVSPEASEPADATPADKMTVNGDSIDAVDLCREMREQLLEKARALSAEDYRAYVERASVDWITDKIAEMLIYQRASVYQTPEVNEEIDKYVDSRIREIISSEYGGIERRFEKHLASRGRSVDDVRTRLKRDTVISAYLEKEVKPKVVEPTRRALLAVFEANVDSWRKPHRRKMSLIDVRVSRRLADVTDYPSGGRIEAARAEARAAADAAHAELVRGTDFAEVVARYSDGLHKGEQGSWGWVRRGTVRKRFEPAVDALYALDEGRFSDVIETEDGFMIVRCDKVDPGSAPTFQDVQPALKERYTRAAYSRLIAELVSELRVNARIEPRNLDRFRAAVVKAALSDEFRVGS